MLQSRTGLWVAGVAAAVVLVSIGYGMGRRAGVSASNPTQALTPAGAPLPAIQIEPIQPQEELAAISSPANSARENRGKQALAAAHETLPPTAASTPASASTPAGGAAAPAAPLPTEESARVREIQKALKAAGFDPGPIDGHLGQKTRTAIRDFQTAQGLEPDGKVGPKTWSRLESFLKKQPATAGTGD